MTNKELIETLSKMPEDIEVMVSTPYFLGPIGSVFGDSDEIYINCSENLA